MSIIAEKNVASADLNLLVAFEALLEEGNVTRAGQRIGLAQPSMSGALRRLRDLFGDELFQRSGGDMVPTPRALVLANPIKEALRQVRLALSQDIGFVPATSRHRFRLAVTDYGDLIVVPPLVRALRALAPGVDLQVHPISDARIAVEQLEHGQIDLMVGGHLPLPRGGLRQRLFDERFVGVSAAPHAAKLAGLDLAGYAALPYALFSASGGDGAPAALDAILAQRGLHRRVVVTLPHAMALPFTIAETDLVAALAERVAHRLSGLAKIAVVPLPVDVPPFSVDLIYTQHSMAAEPVRWLIAVLSDVGRSIGAFTGHSRSPPTEYARETA